MMQTPEIQTPAAASGKALQQSEMSMPVEFIELGMTLDILLENHPVFADAVKAAVLSVDAEFLFELPHGEKADGKGRVAVIRLAYAGAKAPRLAFVILSEDGMETRIEAADGQPEHLTSFAEAFVDVLEKIGQH